MSYSQSVNSLEMHSGIKLSEMFETTISQSHNSSVKKIVKEFPNVVSLNMRHSENLTDIKAIVSFDKKLRSLNLGGCWRIGDSVIEDTVIKLKNLVHLNLAVTKITDYGLQLLGNELKWLNTVRNL